MARSKGRAGASPDNADRASRPAVGTEPDKVNQLIFKKVVPLIHTSLKVIGIALKKLLARHSFSEGGSKTKKKVL